MADAGPRLEVGRVDKAHGVKGEVVVALTTNRDERVAPGAVLYTRSGRRLVIERSRPLQHRWLVVFAGVDDRAGADALHGQVLLAEPIDDPDAFWVHELVGSEVVDVDGERLGAVEAVEENPASDLLVLDGGGLIPLRFVVERRDRTITVDIPPGLLDLD